ncbi:MAG: AMP-dependent synthetase [Acidobacteria bacterium]|nr:MAG: AMP-dependent synthetase [Acidobacteriota bacterium]
MNIAAILHEQAKTLGDRAAIVERGRTISFAELDRGAAAAAADLAAAGLEPGMRALVFSPMSIALYITLIGLFRLGVTAVFVDPSAGKERLAHCIARLRPAAFVAVPRAHLMRLVSPALRDIPIAIWIGGCLPLTARVAHRTCDAAGPVESCSPDTPAIVTFTSGSTGEPKAVVRTHGFLIAQHRALVESLALASGETDLTTLPIFLLANLASGVTSVIPDADLRAPGAIVAAPVLAQIASLAPDRIVASPAFLERLVMRAALTGVGLDSFRRVFTGGAPVFPGMLDAIAALAPAAAVVAVYGSTEAEPIARVDRRDIHAEDRDAMRRGAGLLVGRPEPSVEVRVLADRWGTPLGPWSAEDLERERLGPNRIGEIVVSGDHVLAGYLDGAGDEETKIRVGARVWHRTGDAGRFDEHGRLWLLGRCAARVEDERGVVYPFAVECAASDIAGVRRTAFVLHQKRRVLVVELRHGAPAAAADELLRHLAWAHIDSIRVVPNIPVDRRHNAKVDYPALQALLDQ